MKKIIAAAALLMLPLAAPAQPISVAASKEEWQFILQMCEAAKWANRIQFGEACEPLKTRITEAENAAKNTAPVEVPPRPTTERPNQ